MTASISRQTLYDSFKQIRQIENQPFYRLLIAGYLNDDEVKKENLNTEKYLRDSIAPFLKTITGYLNIKGLFYLHLIESKDMKHLNEYMNAYYKLTQRNPQLHNQIRIVYQCFESPFEFFKKWQCDNSPQSGPILIETDKTEEQIADRSFQIYENLQDGASKKKQNSSHKIGNMFLLSNDDMSILICDRFMSLQQYHDLYLIDTECEKQAESNYPLPPSIFNIMEFLEAEDYQKFK